MTVFGIFVQFFGMSEKYNLLSNSVQALYNLSTFFIDFIIFNVSPMLKLIFRAPGLWKIVMCFVFF